MAASTISLALVLTDEVIDAFDHVFYYLLSSVAWLSGLWRLLLTPML
jgi:hypothetical protein